MLVGDSGWFEEAQTGIPFSGPAGSMLDRLLKRAGIERSTLTIANTTWCKAPRLGFYDNAHKIPEAAQIINHCRPYLDELIDQVKPRVIVPLGNVALRRVAGVNGIEAHQSYFVASPYGVCIPTFHPSNILQGKHNLTPAFVFALRRAQEVANGATQQEFNLILDPSPEELQNYINTLPAQIDDLVLDIETPDSSNLDEDELEENGPSFEIVRAGFSVRPGEAVSFSWSPP